MAQTRMIVALLAMLSMSFKPAICPCRASAGPEAQTRNCHEKRSDRAPCGCCQEGACSCAALSPSQATAVCNDIASSSAVVQGASEIACVPPDRGTPAFLASAIPPAISRPLFLLNCCLLR
ncbi:MAG: hypothetical protein HYY16_18035 [Planctomycetes bacterium]|nr:hypothetical protein [Planctomycetota bacterium]